MSLHLLGRQHRNAAAVASNGRDFLFGAQVAPDPQSQLQTGTYQAAVVDGQTGEVVGSPASRDDASPARRRRNASSRPGRVRLYLVAIK